MTDKLEDESESESELLKKKEYDEWYARKLEHFEAENRYEEEKEQWEKNKDEYE